MSCLRFVYTVILYFLTPLIILRLYWKSRKLKAYRYRIKERFAFNSMKKCDVWVHAVSLGEVVAVTPVIDELLAKQVSVLITTMTPTGSAQVIKRFGDQVSHQYLPYDLPWALRRFFRAVHPSVGLIMETELWPNLIGEANQHSIPLLLINARISDKSYKQYYRMRDFFKPILLNFDSIFAQSDLDAERLLALGASKSQVHVAGNIKFDVCTHSVQNQLLEPLKQALGSHRLVVLAASTHDDEEEQMLSRLRTLQARIPNVLLMIAPRHPERFSHVHELSIRHGFKTNLRSSSEGLDDSTEVFIIDSLGELTGFYAISDYAFVGGSLVPVGGHNVLEPIAMGIPVFTGPFMNNSKAIVSELLTAHAIQCMSNVESLYDELVNLQQEPLKRAQQVLNATSVLKKNQGVTTRLLKETVRFLPPSKVAS